MVCPPPPFFWLALKPAKGLLLASLVHVSPRIFHLALTKLQPFIMELKRNSSGRIHKRRKSEKKNVP